MQPLTTILSRPRIYDTMKFIVRRVGDKRRGRLEKPPSKLYLKHAKCVLELEAAD